jgi:hypothetical protein
VRGSGFAATADPPSLRNICSLQLLGADDLEPHPLEQLRRSVVMLPPGRRDGLDRDLAIAIIEELQRLQRSDRRYRELVGQLRALLASEDITQQAADGSPGLPDGCEPRSVIRLALGLRRGGTG